MASAAPIHTRSASNNNNNNNIESAVSAAIDLVRNYSERDPRDGSSDNPWKNPQAILDELSRARAKIVAAWDDDNQYPDNNNDNDNNNSNKNNEDSIRAAYMDMVTNAFADVLEDMRNNSSSEDDDDELDVDILVDCLQSGMDFLSGEEREMFLLLHEEDMEEEDNDDVMVEKMQQDGTTSDEDDSGPSTPHEQRRQQLGLPVC